MENARSEMIFHALKGYFKDVPDERLFELTECLQKSKPLGSIPWLKLSLERSSGSFIQEASRRLRNKED
jgi:hypothetical protein